jgi:thermitase
MQNRKPQTLLALFLLLSLTFVGLWPVAAQDGEQPRHAPNPPSLPGTVLAPDAAAEFKPGEVLVKFKSYASAASVDSALARYQATRLQTLADIDVQVWQVEEGQELTIVDQLKAEPVVEYAEPNYRYHAFAIPSDPYFGNQWGLTKVQAPAAWDLTTGSTGITIAIIDTGIDPGHPDLASKIVAGYDFVSGDSNPTDGNGHGTHVAGIATAITNNGVGVAGMDWNARIMPIRVLDNSGSGWSSDIASGIDWAWQHGAKVLNLSLGGTSYSSTMQDAVNAAHAAGSLVVAAMGNCRTTGPGCPVANPTNYPAAYNNVMAVAATGPTDTYSSFSQYGAHCDIAAPGGDMSYYHDPNGIYSTMPTYPVYLTTSYSYYTNYDYLNGTSQATPYVAGLAALIWSTNSTLTPDQVQTAIQNTAVDLGTAGWDSNYGWGRINALAAVQVYSVPSVPALYPINNPDGDGSYLVDWSDSANATSYTLQEDDNSGFSSPSTLYSGATSQFSVSGKGPGTWYYRVYAAGGSGHSDWSVIRAVTVKPNAPTLNAISNAGNQDEYLVSWSTSTAATGYTLQEANNASFTSPHTRYMGTALQYQVTGQPGGDWYYRVLATNSAGDSAWSSTQSTTVDPPLLGIPTLAAISNADGDGNYLVDWSDVASATSYKLEQSSDQWFTAPTEVYTGAASQFSVTNQPSGRWYYRARALSVPGNGPWSLPQSVGVTSWAYLPFVAKDYATVPLSYGLPINEGFEGGVVPPSGWTSIQTNPRQTWGTYTSPPYSNPPQQGNYAATCLYDDGGVDPPQPGYQNEILLSPEFKATSAHLQFYSSGTAYWCRDHYDNCDLNVWLVVGNWGGGDDIFVGKADDDWPTYYYPYDWPWVLTSIDMTPYLPSDTPVRLAFQYEGQDGAQVSLDTISVTP